MGLSLCGSPLIVYADDYTYVPVNSWYQYNAYAWFKLYGFDLDYTNTINYDISESGTFSFTGTVNGTILGSQSNSFTVSLSGQLDTLEDGTYVSGSETGGIISSPLGVLSMELTPQDNAYETNIVTACQMSAAVYDRGLSTPEFEYSRMNCTSGGGIEAPSYDVTLNMLGLSTTNSTAYEICISETESGGGSLNGTISLNSTSSFGGSGGFNIIGTSSTTGHKTYDIPILTTNSVDNSYLRIKRFDPDQDYYIAFLSDQWYENVMTLHNDETTVGGTLTLVSDRLSHSGLYTYVYELKNNHEYDYIHINNITHVIPLFVGGVDYMPDDMYQYCFGVDRTNYLIEYGNTNSQSMGNNIDNTTSSFNSAANQFNTIENGFNNDMNTRLNNVPTTSSLNSNNKFLSTANWVRVQFERLVLNTPFELLIVYSLILGIALVLIGKVR